MRRSRSLARRSGPPLAMLAVGFFLRSDDLSFAIAKTPGAPRRTLLTLYRLSRGSQTARLLHRSTRDPALKFSRATADSAAGAVADQCAALILQIDEVVRIAAGIVEQAHFGQAVEGVSRLIVRDASE
jgi:hypothetical protein